MRKYYFVAFTAFLGGCASIVQGSKQDVGINSAPAGAAVLVDNVALGATPVIAHLTRKDSHIVKIELPGYEATSFTVTRGVSGWIAGNIIFGGVIGLAVDAITGAMYKLTPEQLASNLNKKTAMVKQANGLIYVTVVMKADPAWERIGMLSR